MTMKASKPCLEAFCVADADLLVGEDAGMRKLVSELKEDERRALIILSDLGVASFSAGLAVEVLRAIVVHLAHVAIREFVELYSSCDGCTDQISRTAFGARPMRESYLSARLSNRFLMKGSAREARSRISSALCLMKESSMPNAIKLSACCPIK
jgi:hypothetical protein